MHDASVSQWVGFHLLLVTLLAGELLYTRYARRRCAVEGTAGAHRSAVVATLVWVFAALFFGLYLWRALDSRHAIEYISGYAIEEALSIDNLFVFLLLFRLFRIESSSQPRVLFWGVSGAIVLRGAFIFAGLGLLQRFAWVNYVFGAVLLVAAIRLLRPEEPSAAGETPRWLAWLERVQPVSSRQDRFFTVENGRRMVTVLLLALVAIELTDVVFALDSIPAVLSITRHPYLAYTSNIMAVMGLRSLFFVLSHLLEQLRYLRFGLAAILAFASLKMLAERWIAVGPLTSLGVVVSLLLATVALSLALPARSEPAHTS